MTKLLDKVKPLFVAHSLWLLYSLMFTVLLYGVLVESGMDFVGQVLLFFAVLTITYFLLYGFKFRQWMIRISGQRQWVANLQSNPWIQRLPVLMGIFSLLFIVLHYLYLGEVPVVTAWMSTDYYEIVKIRKGITLESGKMMRYISSFFIKSFLPFTLLLLLFNKKWVWYFILFAAAAFYGVSLIQKSFIITILFPVLIYSLISRQWWWTIKYILVIVGAIYVLLYVTNPKLRHIETPPEVIAEQKNWPKPVSMDERNATFVQTIYRRVMLVPGEVVSNWFRHVPNDLPYLNGCGYRFLTPVLPCGFVNYAQEIYPILYPEYAARGIQGNVNVSSFMYDYANFGWKGLILAGLLLALIFHIVEAIYSSSGMMLKLSLNTFYVFMLSSSALTTLLFSGGWGITILIFLLLRGLFREKAPE